jgi:hypothetical protein
MMIAPIYNPTIAKRSNLVARQTATKSSSAGIGTIWKLGFIGAHESLHATTLLILCSALNVCGARCASQYNRFRYDANRNAPAQA